MFNLKLMNFNNLICALLLFFCVGINSLNFPGSVYGRIRRCLLAGLKRLHSNSAPLKTSLNDAETFAFLSRYPVELKQLFVEYLDYKSIKKLSQCNKKAARFTVPIIAQKLATFNPHFAFDDELVNSLLLTFLDKHFPKSKNLQSETIHDELQLLILKYTRDDLNFDSIPKNIYFYLISFINEAVYGVDAIFDSSAQTFCILLLKFKLPESYKYFRLLFAHSFFNFSMNLLWKDDLNFFSQNPSKEELRRHFSIPADINDWVKPREMHNGFYNAILELFYDEFTDENVVKLYDGWSMNYSVSFKAFISRYYSIVDENKLIWAYKYHIFYSKYIKAIICTELSVRFGKTIDTCYFSTRNSLNELSLDRLAFFDYETILEQLRRYNPKTRIYDLEFIVTVMNSDLVSPKLRLEILEYFVKSYCYDIVELIFKETIKPINFFEYCSDHIYTPLTKIIWLVPKKLILEIVDSINDPLLCIMFLVSEFSPEGTSRIVQQKDLDLNKVYRFDFNLDIWIRLFKFVGRTMHFKQILKELNNPKLNEAFRFNSTDLNHDYSTIDESLPVVIVDEYFTFTLNSH
jgi:hypothetical protein